MFLNAPALQTLVNENFMLAGFSKEMPPLPELSQKISFQNSDTRETIAIYFCIVTHDKKL